MQCVGASALAGGVLTVGDGEEEAGARGGPAAEEELESGVEVEVNPKESESPQRCSVLGVLRAWFPDHKASTDSPLVLPRNTPVSGRDCD